MMSPAQRKKRARLAALSRWAGTTKSERRQQTEATRNGYWKALEAKVDPESKLNGKELQKAAMQQFQINMLRGRLQSRRGKR